jgi:hypothetical protein
VRKAEGWNLRRSERALANEASGSCLDLAPRCVNPAACCLLPAACCLQCAPCCVPWLMHLCSMCDYTSGPDEEECKSPDWSLSTVVGAKHAYIGMYSTRTRPAPSNLGEVLPLWRKKHGQERYWK